MRRNQVDNGTTRTVDDVLLRLAALLLAGIVRLAAAVAPAAVCGGTRTSDMMPALWSAAIAGGLHPQCS